MGKINRNIALTVLAVVLALAVGYGQSTMTGHEDHSISAADAKTMTDAYQSQHAGSPYAWTIGRDAVESILKQPGVVGIRIKGGMKDGKFSPVLVGVSADGSEVPGGVIMEDLFPCPPYCG